MASFAYYRQPHEHTYTSIIQTDGRPETFDSFSRLNGRSGFVVAPFAVSDACPIVLIRPDTVERRTVSEPAAAGDGGEVRLTVTSDREAYMTDFASCHARLMSGEYSKIVLARSGDLRTDVAVDAETLFLRACRTYPRMFVVLVHTPQSGTWLAATPEILLEGDGERWRTVALAGTMRLEEGQLGFDSPPSPHGDGAAPGILWSTKNIKEQRYVATYIADSLKTLACDVTEEGPKTVRAGNLVHLRSDFTFALKRGRNVGDVLTALHPTPAVCGLPKAATWRHIVEHEHTERSYYSGFMGPLNHEGRTSLYVSLRCMRRLDDRHFRLYAGGGLLRDSDAAQEWLETEAKMETMKRLFNCGQQDK